MSKNKRERDCDTPILASSSESPQSMMQDDTPRIIAGSRRVNKDSSGPRLSKKIDQSYHQSNQQQPLPSTSTSHSQLGQPNHHQQHPDHSMTGPPSTSTYTLPKYSDELGRLPLHGHLNSSVPYLDQGSYWYPDGDSTVGGSGGRQHQQAQDHNHVQSSHNNTNNYSHTTETSTMTQGFPPDPTMETGNMMYDPMSLGYIPSGSFNGVPPSMDIVSPQNPLGLRERSSHPNFRGVSMASRGDLGDVVNQRQKSFQPRPPSHVEQPQHQHHHHQTQDQRGHHHVHDNHHHREQQQPQQPMGYSYVNNDTMAMWPTAPTGSEYVFFLFGVEDGVTNNITCNIDWMSGAHT